MITPEQRAERRKSIGSSDSPAILHVDPFRCLDDVYAEKVFETEDIKGNEAIERGNDFEAPMLEWASRELGVEIQPDVHRVSPINALFTANHDALIPSRKTEGIEVKTTNMPDQWGAPGTDQVPDHVIVQAHHQMYVSDLDTVWVPVMLARFNRINRDMYCVKRNEKIVEAIVEAGTEFWENHVLPRKPPVNWTPSLDVIARVKRIPGKVLTWEDTDRPAEIGWMIGEWQRLAAEKATAEKAEKEAKAKLLAAIGDAEAYDWGDDTKWLTYMSQSRSGIDSSALKRDHPEIYKQYVRESTYRVARIVKKP